MKQRAFTLIEVLVVVAIIALLIAILMPSLARARELAKRAVCMSNTHQLTLGWTVYAADNKGSTVSGMAAFWMDNPEAWVKQYGNWDQNTQSTFTAANFKKGIMEGALYKYVRAVDAYHCPAMKKDFEILTYSMPVSMNPYSSDLAFYNWNEWRPAYDDGRIATHLSKIARPANRFVFMDHFSEDADFLWAIHYITAGIWNPIPGRHTKGTVFSFADGHSTYKLWTSWKVQKAACETWDECIANLGTVGGDLRDQADFRWLYLGTWEKKGPGGYPGAMGG